MPETVPAVVETTPTPPPSPSPSATPTSTPWTSAITDGELLGHFQNHGWDRLDPAQAAAEAGKAHRNAERMLGAPADRLLRLPARQDDEAGWRSVFQKLGAPEKPDDYHFEGIEFDGRDGATDRFVQSIRETAAELNMPKAMAERMAQAFHKYVAGEDAAIQAEQQAQLQDEAHKLAQDWGQPGSDRFRANEFIADQAMKQLGISQEAVNKIRDGIGGAEAARMFLKIGLAMGEDKYVAGQNPAQPGLMSREQAQARRSELMHDKEFVRRYTSGEAAARREMTALDTIIVGAMT